MLVTRVARWSCPMQYHGAWLRVGVGRQHHQGDIEEALVVRRRRRWAAWRRGAWTSSCGHAATSSAVLCRSFGVVPQLQFIDTVDGGASCASLCCAQRQVPTLLSFWQGSVCCSTLTRLSMLGTRLLYGGLRKNFTYFQRGRAVRLESRTLFP